MKQDQETRRLAMVEQHIAARGVVTPAVLNAMRKVPRERFVAPRLRKFAYDDTPLPIAAGQTISQPFIVALMTDALGLNGGERVLEIGTGSGYAAAVLAEIAAAVYSVERIGELAEQAAAVLARLGYDNVHIRCGDGSRGWPEHAPYDAIVVTAGAPAVPHALRAQLAVGGRLVIPVGGSLWTQRLVRIARHGEHDYRQTNLGEVRFVPLIGEQGWAENGALSAPPV